MDNTQGAIGHSAAESVAKRSLPRVLGLWDLVFFGIVLIQPIGSVGLFGIVTASSRGHMATTLLIAMLAMMLTAVSYGRMASIYPSAGSAYVYVSHALGERLGFIAGWAMVLDYLIVPIVSTVYGALTLAQMFPAVPYVAWVVIICALTTTMNIAGVRAAARTNVLLLLVMCVVIIAFISLCVRYVLAQEGFGGLFTLKPFYDSATFNLAHVLSGTSLVALTYIGFDGVTTLAEDVVNPKRNILLASTLLCAITGLLSVLQIYCASIAWPDYSTFLNLDTAFLEVCRRVGGEWLFQAMAATLAVACVGTALTGQLGSARLLYGMGRNGALPSRYFGQLSARTCTPLFNTYLVGIVTIVGSLTISYEQAAGVLNFGAFLAFMGVNASVINIFLIKRQANHRRNILFDGALPLAGFLFCMTIWYHLPSTAKWIGCLWTLVGIIYHTINPGVAKGGLAINEKG